MNNQPDQETLEQVLDAYMAASLEPSRNKLIEWIRKYPKYQQELTDFTVSWIQMETLPPYEREEIDLETMSLRGMSVVQNLLFQKNKVTADREQSEKIIKSLLKECSSEGYSQEQFARNQFISPAMLRKLDLRLISYETMPVPLLESLASLLHCTLTNIANYFQGPQLQPVGARQKSKQAPIISEKRNFFDEVRNDLTLDEEFRQYWLSVEPKKD